MYGDAAIGAYAQQFHGSLLWFLPDVTTVLRRSLRTVYNRTRHECASKLRAPPPEITFLYQAPGGEEADRLIEHKVRWLEDVRWQDQSDDGETILYSFVQMETVSGVYGAIIRSDGGDRELFVPYDGQTTVPYGRKPGGTWESLPCRTCAQHLASLADSSRRERFGYFTRDRRPIATVPPDVLQEQVDWTNNAKGRWTESRIRMDRPFEPGRVDVTIQWEEVGAIAVEGFSGGAWSDLVNLDTGEAFE